MHDPENPHGRSLPYVWDYDFDEKEFRRILDGEVQRGRLDGNWAAVRLLEYASYPEIIRLLGFARLIDGWPRWRASIRSPGRKRGFDFLVDWLPQNHPELCKLT